MKTKEFHNKIKAYARANRKSGTIGEATLWKHVLKAKKTGYQFNRQFVIDRYIVDFISRKLKLIIEIDGESHLLKEAADDKRQKNLESKGYMVIRFSELDVTKHLEDVSNRIYEIINNIVSKD